MSPNSYQMKKWNVTACCNGASSLHTLNPIHRALLTTFHAGACLRRLLQRSLTAPSMKSSKDAALSTSDTYQPQQQPSKNGKNTEHPANPQQKSF